MSIRPIETIAKCDKCSHSWIEYRNTLDITEKKCPKCGNKVIIF